MHEGARSEEEVHADVAAVLRQQGFHGLTTPVEYGGFGLGPLAVCVVLEELGRLPLSFFTAVRSANGIGAGALIRYGTDAQRQEWLPRIATGEVTTAFALTEPGAGSDTSAMRTRATLKEDVYALNGVKHYITNGHAADLMTVVARTRVGDGDEMVCLMLEPRKTAGFSVRRLQPSLAGTPDLQAEIEFDGVELPAANVIGSPEAGLRIVYETLDEGRLHISAVALGMAQAACDEAIGYARARETFGRRIVDHQGIQWKLADMATQIHASRQMLYDACRRMADGEPTHELAAMVKLFVTETSWRVIDEALQIHGGLGYMRGIPVEQMYRDIRLLRIVEGTSEILRRLISKPFALVGGA